MKDDKITIYVIPQLLMFFQFILMLMVLILFVQVLNIYIFHNCSLEKQENSKFQKSSDKIIFF
jgi:hypothetical protein